MNPTLHAAVVDQVVAHARRAAPEECCGILIGRANDVVEAVPARNIAQERTTRFLIEPRDHLHALRDARHRGLSVVGFYHSHPRSLATPSETDLAEANYPGLLSLIVGLGPHVPDVRLYRLVEDRLLPVALNLVSSIPLSAR